MDSEQRHTEAHVLYESRTWAAAFTLDLTISNRLLPSVATRLKDDRAQLLIALKACCEAMLSAPNSVLGGEIVTDAEVRAHGRGAFLVPDELCTSSLSSRSPQAFLFSRPRRA